jgi:hypothetical protein
MNQHSTQHPIFGTRIHFYNESTSTLHIFGDDDEFKHVHIDATGSVNLPTIRDPRFLDSLKAAAVGVGLIKEHEEIALIC